MKMQAEYNAYFELLFICNMREYIHKIHNLNVKASLQQITIRKQSFSTFERENSFLFISILIRV